MNKFISRVTIYLSLFFLLAGISFLPGIALGFGVGGGGVPVPPVPNVPTTHTDRFVCAPDGQTPNVILRSYESGVDTALSQSVCAPGDFSNSTACYNQNDHVYTCALSSSNYSSSENECKSVNFNYIPTVSSSCSGVDKFICNAGYMDSGGVCVCQPGFTWSAWTPLPSTICIGTSFTQSRTDNCSNVQTRTANGTKHSTVYNPATNSVCQGRSFTQTGDCGDTRQATGDRSCGWKEVRPSF